MSELLDSPAVERARSTLHCARLGAGRPRRRRSSRRAIFYPARESNNGEMRRPPDKRQNLRASAAHVGIGLHGSLCLSRRSGILVNPTPEPAQEELAHPCRLGLSMAFTSPALLISASVQCFSHSVSYLSTCFLFHWMMNTSGQTRSCSALPCAGGADDWPGEISGWGATEDSPEYLRGLGLLQDQFFAATSLAKTVLETQQ